MNLSLPISVRADLEHLELTETQVKFLEILLIHALLVGNYGAEENITKAIRKSRKIRGKRKGEQDWPKFIFTHLVSKEELVFLVSDESPLCERFDNGLGTPAWRYRLLLDGLHRGEFAPLAMRRLWERELEISGGNTLAAEINLGFTRGEHSSRKGARLASKLKFLRVVKRFNPFEKLE